MTGSTLLEWLNDESYGRRLAGAYLSGFMHGQVTCESRAESFKVPLAIPPELDVALLSNAVRRVANENPELLNLDVATFMYAVFERSYQPASQGNENA